MGLLVVGLNYRTAPVRLLERAAVPRDELAGVMHALLGGEHVSEAVLLSTCNRVEVYADVSAFHGALHEIGQTLSERTGLHLAKLADYLYIHYADDAVRHLFAVVSGLDSLVVGESQILGQVRDAYTTAQAHGGPGRVLHEVMQRALRVGKRVHTDTAIDAAGASVLSAALALAEERVGPVQGRPALVVGAGSMGALAAATLRRTGAGMITVLNRTPDAAVRVAGTVGGHGGGLDELPAVLAAADVVVSATGASAPVITLSSVSAALAHRGDRPLVILDLALPRDTERAVDTLPGVTVLDIEQLTAALAGTETTAAVADARAIVDTETEVFLAWQRSTEVAPTVVALRDKADRVVATELDRLAARLPDLPVEARAELERTVRRVVSTLLHLPTVRMKELASVPGGDRYAAAVRDLFLLDVTDPAGHAALALDLVLEDDATSEVTP